MKPVEQGRVWREGVARSDQLAVETPVAFEYNGISHAVMLATPSDLEDFAVGFSLSEGIVARRGDIFGIEVEESAAGITLKIEIAAGDFMRLKQRRRSLADSHVGILGWGGVGRALATRLERFEVQVTGFSRSGSAGSRTIEAFDETCAWLDIVVLALPLTPQTQGFMGPRRLDSLAEGALLVNVGRGALIDTDALLVRAGAGRLRAALDVTDPEPLPPEHPLWRCPGVLITPHLGGDSEAFVPRARRMVDRQLQLLAAGAFD